MDLNKKNIVYIGGCGGIGSATCRRLLQRKVANLAILDLVENAKLVKELKALNATTNVVFWKIDIRHKKDIDRCLNEVNSRFGHIDILVNGSGLFNEIDAEVNIEVNLLGPIQSTMTTLALMDKSKGNLGGLIVNISSVTGLDPCPHLPIYSASKAGMILFTRTLAEEATFSQTGVSLIVICPGLTRTPLLDQCTDDSLTPNWQAIRTVIDTVKNQTPDDCAKGIIEAIEINKNGAVYVCDVGQNKEINIPRFWDVQK